MRNSNQEEMIEIGSAICLLEPIFLSKPNLDKLTIVIDAGYKGKAWWEIGYSLKSKPLYFYPVAPINYLNETHVLLSYFYEEFLYTDIHSKECKEFLVANFKIHSDWLYSCNSYFEFDRSAHSKVKAVRTLTNWLNKKNLPKSDIDYLVNLKRIQPLTK
jgi:hypothetical protein